MASHFKLGTVLAALSAIGFGILLSPLPYQHALFRWIPLVFPSSIGIMPVLTPRPWSYSYEEFQNVDLRGQSALVTGGNSGIGFELCKALSRRGASVTMACRNPQRCFAAVDRIRKDEGYSGAPISPLMMDVSSLASVQRAAKTYLHHNSGHPLDMLFLNAGISTHGSTAEEGADADRLPTSEDGIEMVFATNVVGHHLLYRILEPTLKNSTTAGARVVSTTSVASIWFMPPHGFPYYGSDASSLVPATIEALNEGRPSFTTLRTLYGRSKLAQAAWTGALTRRLGDKSNIYANAFHPGAVYTPLMDNFYRILMPRFAADFFSQLSGRVQWSAEEAALTGLYLGVEATDENRRGGALRGKYFHPQSVEYDHPHAEDEDLQANVWRLCEDLVQGFL